MRRTSIVLAIVVTLGSLMIGGGVGAQPGSPVPPNGAALDLAAMALSPDDVPAGFFDDYGEWLVPPAAFSELVLGGDAVPADLELVYQSFYFSDAEQVAIHNYLFAFNTSEAADSSIVDATVLRPPLPDGTVDGPTTEPGPTLGDSSSIITRVSYDTQAEGGPLVDVVASTFQRDRLVAGVAIERWHWDAPAQASPVAVSQEDADLAAMLATTLDARITTVMSGGTPAGTDLALSAMVIPVDRLAPQDTPVIGGYKAGIDLLRCGICGEENALVPFAGDALDGVSRTIFVGPLVDGEPSPPFISVAITPFTGPDVALEVLEAIRHAPNDRPTPGPVPRGERTLVEDPGIVGTTASLAFVGVLDAENPNAIADSAGVTFVVDSWLVTIDIQGGLSDDAALAVAVDLATQQSACLTAGGPCQDLTVPDALGMGVTGTPPATPAS